MPAADEAPSNDAAVPKPSAEDLDFFEKKIRPVLVDRCYKCHSAQAQSVKGGLLLDTREGIRRGGESGHAVVPGDPENSLLLSAIRHESFEMPPDGKLPEAVIRDFELWIRRGAADPRDGSPATIRREIDIEQGRQFWAFQPPRDVPPPQVANKNWPLTPVDQFVLSAMEAQGLQPVAPAEPRSLVRRLYFDLIGLPPTAEDVEAFAANPSPAALRALVDRLLQSPQFGERWGRHWLDVVRYGESNGRDRNFYYAEAWRYRDYVIASFNADKPLDQFIREQIAGDLLEGDPASRAERLIATGFLAIGPKSLNERNREAFLLDMIDEQIDVTTRAFMALTVACARCHDHKFDPIPTRDYYALAGIFRSTQTHYGVGTARNNRQPSKLLALPASDSPQLQAQREQLQQQLLAAQEQLAQLQARRGPAASSGDEPPPRPNKANQKKKAQQQKGQQEPAQRPAPAAQPESIQNSPQAAQIDALQQQIAALRSQLNDLDQALQPAGACMGVEDGVPTDSPIYVRGEVGNRGPVVPRGMVSVVTRELPAIPQGASGRLQLAQWIASPDNPLTARVFVNRVWHHLFGQGLVATVDNFGQTGERPSHPELLDYLARRFVADGWSVKRLIRELVLSRTYQLSTAHHQANAQIDPGNRYLWRMPPRRLDAESLRDAMLAASGQLESTPPRRSLLRLAPDTEINRVQESGSDPQADRYRSVYLPLDRVFVHDMLQVFDVADPSLVVGQRDVTTVPAQALYLMNSPFVLQQAGHMAARLLAHERLDDTVRANLAYRIALSRDATSVELQRAIAFVHSIQENLQREDSAAQGRTAAWTALCQALFASAEFRYLD
jgi:hypothetical protein